MWRVQGFVGRVLNRCHGNAPLRLPQNHHVEDEVISSSTVLSTSCHSSDSSSQKGEDGERRKKQKTSQFCYAELPRYTALDAVGWGAAALLFMQICRRIHSQFSSGSEPSPSPTPGALAASSTLHKCGYRIVLETLSRRDVLPRGRSVLCLQGAPERQSRVQSLAQDSSSSSSSSSGSEGSASSSTEQGHLTTGSPFSDHQRADLSTFWHQSCSLIWCALSLCVSQDVPSDEEKLTGAALNLRHVADSSVPVILNIIGLESAKTENYEAAFTCFLAAAEHGYNKAQFNTGVCYERGRGVRRDREKALHYYQQAAVQGHRQAQYRYAKLLLTSRGQKSMEALDTAIGLLEQAAADGLTEAQVCLASVFSQEPVRDGRKSVHYLKMAAERGDGTALLFLGQCYESGFGVQHNLMMAIDFYKRAARAGNSQAQSLLTPPSGTEEDAVLRSTRSAPCFFISDHLRQQLLSSLTNPVCPSSLPLLPHSWSTGSLGAQSALSSTSPHLHPHPQAQSTQGGPCQWTVGIG
uniref:DAP3 binding cell death enhancer 1 n=1 Tax=Myripristis murdjan TaxID=586833 RepID=A0A667WQF5_9TELE